VVLQWFSVVVNVLWHLFWFYIAPYDKDNCWHLKWFPYDYKPMNHF